MWQKRTTGFDAWRDYLLGKDDGVPKTPEWQEAETGVPAHVVRALARAWGAQEDLSSARAAQARASAGACRTATGAQWARSMILMMAMQGWGKPGINFGNLQGSTPLDFTFYFPGYAEGGISGDLVWTGFRGQQLRAHAARADHESGEADDPAAALPGGDHRGQVQGLPLGRLVARERSSRPSSIPMPGYSRVHMLYRYGGSSSARIANSRRFIEAYRHPRSSSSSTSRSGSRARRSSPT